MALAAFKCDDMNLLKIVVALVCCYGLFVSVSYLLMRLIFPKIEVEEEEESERTVKLKTMRRMQHRPLRKQKNLAY